MKKITTADCRKFLTTDPACRQVWLNAYNPSHAEGAQETAWCNKTLSDAANPKKWKRQGKYTVGSKTDQEGNDNGVGGGDYANHWGLEDFWREHGVKPEKGDVVREFWLEDTDHCTIALLEKNGKLYFLDDLSD